MAQFPELTGVQKATEVVRWFGVLPAALLVTVALNHLIQSTSWPLHYVSESVTVIVGAIVAPRFRVRAAGALAALIVLQSLVNHVQFHESLSFDFFFDSFKAVCGVGLMYAVGLITSGATSPGPRSDDVSRLVLALIALSAMLVLCIRHYRRLDAARNYSDQYLEMMKTRRSSPERSCDYAVSTLATRINAYHEEHGVYPSQTQFVDYVNSHGYNVLDPWKNTLRYKRLAVHRFKVWSIGRDGVSGNNDDNTLTQVFGKDPVHDSFTRRDAMQRVERYKMKSAAAQ